MEYVYHVVTEKSMVLGQKIVFDEENHNGVYNRVMTFKRIVEGEDVRGELADFIKSDMEKWAKVAYRELALEEVRRKKYPQYPSRMACLYTSKSVDTAQSWAKFFQDIGRDVYSIVRLRVVGNVFDADARNCFDGTEIMQENIDRAEHYWKNDIVHDKPVIETLVDGDIYVDEIIIDYKSV